MLTVKHIAPGGAETIYEAHRVVTEITNTGGLGTDFHNVRIDEVRAGWLDLAGGMAYVMNDKANTVAKYHLPPAPAVQADTSDKWRGDSVQGPQRPMTLADQSR